MTLIVPFLTDGANTCGGSPFQLSKIFSYLKDSGYSLMFNLSANLRWCAQNIFGSGKVSHEGKKSLLARMCFLMIVAKRAIIKSVRLLGRVRLYVEARFFEKPASEYCVSA